MRTLRGKISDHLPARLLLCVREQRETGVLKLSWQGMSKTVYAVSGEPVNAEGTSRDETLGRYLIKSGRLSEEDCEKSIRLMFAQGLLQGAALVKLGCLKPKELYQSLKNHTREKILAALAWTEGDYHFEPEVSFVEDLYRFEFNFYQLLLQGTRSYMPLGVIERELARVPLLPIVPVDNFSKRVAGFGLSEDEAAWLSRIDGRQTLPALIQAMGGAEAAERLLYLLLLTGLLGPAGKPCQELREVLVGAKAADPHLQFPFAAGSETSPEVLEELPLAEANLKGPEDILSAYMEIKTLDLFAVLGVNRNLGDAEVEAAYRRRMAEFDRAQFQSVLPAEAEAKLEEIVARLIRAYESLKTEVRRAGYLAQVKETAPQKRPQRRLESERWLQEGMNCVRHRDFVEAQARFEKAVRLWPQEPEYYGYLGWTIYLNPSLELEKRQALAQETIRMAISMNPRLDSPHVFLGKIFKDQGRLEDALAEFRLALECNPNCREAQRELQAFQESRGGSAP